MRKKLQIIAAAFLAVSLMLALVACDSGTPGNSTPVQATDDPNAPTHTVTLDPAGGAWSDGSTNAISVSVKEGKAIDFPSYMPEFEGNTLYGWYQTDGSPWPGARKVTGDITLRAKWSVTVEEEVYKLVLTIDGEPVVMEYENGVYQFTFVSSIYGGYAQRAGKYTVYEDDLLAAMEADDGSVQRVIYLAESNYIDATGTLYAEFYNDGEFELYYDYTNAGERTKYPMNVGYWTYEGYTAPFENTPIPEASQMGYESAHANWDASLIGGETGGGEDPPESTLSPGSDAEIPEPDEVIYTADATESETMKANFSANGTMAIYMTTYETNIDAKYLWTAGEDGLVITYNGAEDNIAVDNGDGTYTFSDNYGNDYAVSLADLLAAVN